MSNVTYERVNWEDSPSQNTPINQTNLNKMDKGIADCAAAVNSCNERVEECFQSASDGKALIASAITGKGIETASDATYETMAQNIVRDLMKIPTASLNITNNGTYDVKDYGSVIVNADKTHSVRVVCQFEGNSNPAYADWYYYLYVDGAFIGKIYAGAGHADATFSV
jgi:hypothetical protein